MKSDRSLGIHIAQDQLLVFTNKYVRYEDFEKIIDKSLEVLLKHMRFIDIGSMGVRYVDHIKMGKDEKYSDYINESLLPSDFKGLDRVGGIIFGVYKENDVELRVRCITQPNALSVPEDMIGLAAMTQEPGKPIEIKTLQNSEFLLDMDAIKQYLEPQRMMNRKDILDLLKQLHQVANSFFRNEEVCTDHAFKSWKGGD
jgi:uncharacterized protein (TIGR04255 family)